jgi:hypothetical protein
MLSTLAMSKQSDQTLCELVSTRGATSGLRKLCVRGELSYLFNGSEEKLEYIHYSDTPK